MNRCKFQQGTRVGARADLRPGRWAGVLIVLGTGGAVPGASPVDFNRDIRPILSDKCFTCHGPNDESRKAGLRLDSLEGATGELRSGGRALVTGDPAASVILERLRHPDEDERMPPSRTKLRVTPDEIDLIERWIAEGGTYQPHWAYRPPARPEKVRAEGRGLSDRIDRYVRARLRDEGLEPQPETDKATLIRRVTFDLTGLPPTLEEVDAFLADESADAYGRVVDRLLASPRFGERMATDWLDLARYADTYPYRCIKSTFMSMAEEP